MEASPVDVKLEPTEDESLGAVTLEETVLEPLLEPMPTADELATEEALSVALDELILSGPIVEDRSAVF